LPWRQGCWTPLQGRKPTPKGCGHGYIKSRHTWRCSTSTPTRSISISLKLCQKTHVGVVDVSKTRNTRPA
jgi:hypothetical protein